jgi:hypothetical protein
MTVEQGAHKGRPYVMSIPVGATLVAALLRRLRISRGHGQTRIGGCLRGSPTWTA